MSELINNREHRIAQLKDIILHLHRGLPPDQVRARLADVVKETDATEIAAMEQQLMADGLSVDEIRSMCDLHAEVLRDVTRPLQIRPRLVAGHPAETFGQENQAIRALTAELRRALAALDVLDDAADPQKTIEACRTQVHALFEVFKHYDRKEQLLFPCLERHGVTGPSKVMWAKDDDVRSLVKALGEAFSAEGASVAEWRLVAATIGEPALAAVEAMVDKEERILLPMALDVLTREEWGDVWTESPRFGWCLVEPGDQYQPPVAVVPRDTVEVPSGRAMVFPTGHLTFDQLWGIFSMLPVDLTFVDADNRVAFFSEGSPRVFARSRAVIGRLVQHCHPPKSVATVDRILDDFRSGREHVAEFWLTFQGRFVHVRYFAVRSAGGTYLGCLEVTQDVTAIRALEGERRLLHYDAADSPLHRA